MLVHSEGQVRIADQWRAEWFELDTDTGLPRVLDEGAFFRVRAAGTKEDEARLKLTYRRKRWFWFDKVYGRERYVRSVDGEILPEHLLEAAVSSLTSRKYQIEDAAQREQDLILERQWAKELKARKKLERRNRAKRAKPVKPKRTPRAERPTAQLKYVGDYPPKSLNKIEEKG